MYSGNGNNGYNGNYNGNRYASIGGFRVRAIYLYVALAVVALVTVYFLINFINTSLVIHFGVFAGALLLVANLRELIGNSYAQRSGTALLNCMIGAALVFAWLSQVASQFMWIPAIALVAIATPLAIGRASVYSSYVAAARTAVGTARRAVGR